MPPNGCAEPRTTHFVHAEPPANAPRPALTRCTRLEFSFRCAVVLCAAFLFHVRVRARATPRRTPAAAEERALEDGAPVPPHPRSRPHALPLFSRLRCNPTASPFLWQSSDAAVQEAAVAAQQADAAPLPPPVAGAVVCHRARKERCSDVAHSHGLASSQSMRIVVCVGAATPLAL